MAQAGEVSASAQAWRSRVCTKRGGDCASQHWSICAVAWRQASSSRSCRGRLPHGGARPARRDALRALMLLRFLVRAGEGLRRPRILASQALHALRHALQQLRVDIIVAQPVGADFGNLVEQFARGCSSRTKKPGSAMAARARVPAGAPATRPALDRDAAAVAPAASACAAGRRLSRSWLPSWACVPCSLRSCATTPAGRLRRWRAGLRLQACEPHPRPRSALHRDPQVLRWHGVPAAAAHAARCPWRWSGPARPRRLCCHPGKRPAPGWTRSRPVPIRSSRSVARRHLPAAWRDHRPPTG